MKTISLAIAFSLLSLVNVQAQELDIERIQRATVYIYQVRGDNLTTTCIGSGTLVSYDGLILTNAHHIVQSASCPGDTLIIAMTQDLNAPPIPRYRAELVQFDQGLDVAILRITRELDGRLIDRSLLPVLPFVELADSDAVSLDSTVTIAGYPTIGNSPTFITRASIAGFLAEPSGGEKSWFKIIPVEAIPGIVTGGGAYDISGRLIGIPTTAPIAQADIAGSCVYLEDTNNDGFINRNDTCIATGDFITVLRPSNFARPLLRGASLELTVTKLTSPQFRTQPAGTPAFRRLFFSPSITDNTPSTVIGSVPSGTDRLYLFFDYENMSPETTYELRVSIDGIPSNAFSLPPVRWGGGERGIWYVGSIGQPYPNGVYQYRLYINGVAVADQTILIGGSAQVQPTFSNVVFGLLDDSGRIQGNGYVLPAGNIATAQFIYQNMSSGIPWTAIWYFNRGVIARTDDVWRADDGENGAYPLSLQPSGGLLPGTYRLELYLNERLTTTGDFVVAGAQETVLPRVFTNLRFLRSNSPQDLPTGTPSSAYPDGVNTLYAIFDWEQIAIGTDWTLQLSVDNTPFYRETIPWNISEQGSDYTVRLNTTGDLPDGTYEASLYVNDIRLTSGRVAVGIGQLPIDRFASAEGIRLRGTVVDETTGNGIEGATFYLISEQFAVSDFVWNFNQLYAIAVTDRNGRFEIDRPLQLEVPYSVLVEANGYLSKGLDGFRLNEENDNPLDIFISMVRS